MQRPESLTRSMCDEICSHEKNSARVGSHSNNEQETQLESVSMKDAQVVAQDDIR